VSACSSGSCRRAEPRASTRWKRCAASEASRHRRPVRAPQRERRLLRSDSPAVEAAEFALGADIRSTEGARGERPPRRQGNERPAIEGRTEWVLGGRRSRKKLAGDQIRDVL